MNAPATPQPIGSRVARSEYDRFAACAGVAMAATSHRARRSIRQSEAA